MKCVGPNSKKLHTLIYLYFFLFKYRQFDVRCIYNPSKDQRKIIRARCPVLKNVKMSSPVQFSLNVILLRYVGTADILLTSQLGMSLLMFTIQAFQD